MKKEDIYFKAGNQIFIFKKTFAVWKKIIKRNLVWWFMAVATVLCGWAIADFINRHTN